MEFGSIALGAVVGMAGGVAVQMFRSRRERTLALDQEYSSRDMLLDRMVVWKHAPTMFCEGNFDTQCLRSSSKELEDSVLLRFIRIAWFYRKIAKLANADPIDRTTSGAGESSSRTRLHVEDAAGAGTLPRTAIAQ